MRIEVEDLRKPVKYDAEFNTFSWTPSKQLDSGDHSVYDWYGEYLARIRVFKIPSL